MSIQVIPNEIIIDILKSSPPRAVLSFCETNKKYQKLCDNESFWESLVKHIDPKIKTLPKSKYYPIISWRDFYSNWAYKTETEDEYEQRIIDRLNMLIEKKKYDADLIYIDNNSSDTYGTMARSQEEAFLKNVKRLKTTISKYLLNTEIAYDVGDKLDKDNMDGGWTPIHGIVKEIGTFYKIKSIKNKSKKNIMK